MKLRGYQSEAVEAVMAAFEEVATALLVLPTGTGKTIIFAHVAERMRSCGRVMILAHREELIWQAAHKVHAVTGAQADIEMAEMCARDGLFDQANVVVSSIQTQNSGRNGSRKEKFNPSEFGLLIVDEAHHSCAASYKRAIAHYRQNAALKVLGVTATPDRHDEEALGQVFERVAYDYELPDAIRDGWLVPIEQRSVHVDGLDYSSIRTTAGDLNGADLARVMEYEDNLHRIAHPTFELAGGRKTLVFAASLAHAERLCEIFNRHAPDCARWVHGGTPKEERRAMLRDYAAKRFRFLVNVGVATEGFDDPGIEVVAIARPTKSRALYSQMVGRGTRPLPHLVEDVEEAEERRLTIAMSGKPELTVLDFVGNSGKHKLVTTADILGGNYSDEVIEKAKKEVEEAGKNGIQLDMSETLADAEKTLREMEERQERARRAALRAKASYRTTSVDPFDVLHVQPWKERGWDKGKPVSEKMKSLLARNGIEAANLSFIQARQLTQELFRRWEGKLCTFRQAKLLSKRGYDTANLTMKDATALIDGIAAREGWKSTARKESA